MAPDVRVRPLSRTVGVGPVTVLVEASRLQAFRL